MFDKCYMIALDALLDEHKKPAEGSGLLIRMLNEMQIPYVVMTEQSARTRAQIIEGLEKEGLHGIGLANLYTSSMAAVDYALYNYPMYQSAAMIGGSGLKEALTVGKFTNDLSTPKFLFAGMDRNMSYMDYSYALQALLNGALFFSVDDRKIMKSDGLDLIGNGAVVKMLEEASGVKAEHFGRGSGLLIKYALRYLSVNAGQAVMIGDDFQKDIIPALPLRVETVLITNGGSIMEMGVSDALHPDYIVEDLFGLCR